MSRVAVALGLLGLPARALQPVALGLLALQAMALGLVALRSETALHYCSAEYRHTHHSPEP